MTRLPDALFTNEIRGKVGNNIFASRHSSSITPLTKDLPRQSRQRQKNEIAPQEASLSRWSAPAQHERRRTDPLGNELASSKTLMVDLKDNPIFFVCFFLALKSEWWFYSLIFRSIVKSVTEGIHNQKGRDVVLFLKRANKLTRTLTCIDMVSRIAGWIVPSLIGGYTNNAYNLTVISVFSL